MHIKPLFRVMNPQRRCLQSKVQNWNEQKQSNLNVIQSLDRPTGLYMYMYTFQLHAPYGTHYFIRCVHSASASAFNDF